MELINSEENFRHSKHFDLHISESRVDHHRPKDNFPDIFASRLLFDVSFKTVY